MEEGGRVSKRWRIDRKEKGFEKSIPNEKTRKKERENEKERMREWERKNERMGKKEQENKKAAFYFLANGQVFFKLCFLFLYNSTNKTTFGLVPVYFFALGALPARQSVGEIPTISFSIQ